MNQQSINDPKKSDVFSGSGAASCSRSFEMPLDAALEFADSGESTGGIMTHEALKTLAASIRMMSENPKCLCGEDSTGWTEVKCCNICGLPHKNEMMPWGFHFENVRGQMPPTMASKNIEKQNDENEK